MADPTPPDRTDADPPADRLNEIGVLKRREVEARIVAPLLEALGREFGRERVLEVARRTIIGIAQGQGAALAGAMGGNDLAHFAGSMANWTKDDALRIEVLEQTEEAFSFNVVRCRYAEMYRALGVPELGAVLSCGRDYSMVEGFNDDIELTRTQTIMQGAACCDFRYRLRRPSTAPARAPSVPSAAAAGRKRRVGGRRRPAVPPAPAHRPARRPGGR